MVCSWPATAGCTALERLHLAHERAGTCARLAVMHARGQVFDHQSIIGTHFLGEVIETTRVGDTPAVVTTVAGQAWITSIGQYGYDPTDPFPEGYTLADTWLRAI